ncbi:hypothetical protein [Phaeocystidibacter luteus]|uniref:PNPLA domain-containing protein n=1 Tax=Phaeocystidibacter luteus TaxID=911197 RepID=A0A6N6RMH8_9FLAO|nr:hypothetical protein [Phaeocystidibacter luteus]KAB2814769.1 hypothetical protein F8C67_03210 [Phaeocystidibacter luteus]
MTESQRKIWLQVKLYALALARFFPIQLLAHHLKRSWLFLAFWVLLFGMASGSFFKTLGIPYLFSTPEYLEKVNPLSYFIVGVVLGLFTMAFHISSYIFYSHRFPFLATLSRPLYRFSFNNSIIPVAFFFFYAYQIFQELNADGMHWPWILANIGGMFGGVVTSLTVSFSWFFSTIRSRVFEKIGERLDKTLRLVIVEEKSADKLDLEGHHRVVTYLKNFHSVRWARDTSHYAKSDLLQILQQHHSNAALFLLIVTVVMLSLGYFADQPILMIPAGASIVLLLTFYLMIVGAIYSRFKSWTFGILMGGVLIINYLSGTPYFQKDHYAFGLEYETDPAVYTISELEKLCGPQEMERDKALLISTLEKWKAKTGESKPKLILLNSSGGGLRSSLWSFSMLQRLDSETNGKFWDNCFLITGSSGGMVGTAYFRELEHRGVSASAIGEFDKQAYVNLGKDILNPIGFSLISNDLFWSLKKFQDAGSTYNYDRGWAFERQLDANTNHVFPTRWSKYEGLERSAQIPWMILSPTVINEGRRLMISNIGVSYLMRNTNEFSDVTSLEIDGVDFFRFFKNQRSDSLRTTSALRLSATFPYITPLASMPSEPRMEVIDAGARDNNGFELSLRVIYQCRDWIEENTSGVVFVQLMANEPPSDEIAGSPYQSRFDALIKPIGGVVNSFANLQGFSASEHLSFASSWVDFPMEIISFQLMTENETDIALSWHLTEREKEFIFNSAQSERIGKTIDEVNYLLGL